MPRRDVDGERLGQEGRKYEPKPRPSQACRLASPAHPVIDQGQHRPGSWARGNPDGRAAGSLAGSDPPADHPIGLAQGSCIRRKDERDGLRDPLAYKVLISDPIPTSVTEPIPNGDRFSWSPMATTLIYDEQDAVLIDPPLTTGQAQRVRD